MTDIDLTTGDFTSISGLGFARGNKLLANLFQITLMSSTVKGVDVNGVAVNINGGDLNKILSSLSSPVNMSAIATVAISSIQRTIDILLSDETSSTPNTERISDATITNAYMSNGAVIIDISIIPVEYDFGVKKIDVSIPIRSTEKK